MRMYDLIVKKRNGKALSEAEIRELIRAYTAGEIPDYQMAAFLMAVYFQGMTDAETHLLTDAMAGSGERLDLSGLPGVKVDKHSTGGVGDKTTMIVAPIVAACGCTVAKLSGRGLGHTGGTVDKLESIPGMRTELPAEEFLDVVRRTGIAVTGQSPNLAPADKRLYALRDVTGTVDSIPLIASSIMSKKLAAGAEVIVLDVKTGSGSFMKTVDDATMLAEKMVDIGTRAGRRMAALVTDMDVPLGYQIGNALEVCEAVDVLRRGAEAAGDLWTVCAALATEILFQAGKGDRKACEALVQEAVSTGAALEKLAEMVEAQGGDASYIYEPARFGTADIVHPVLAPQTGTILQMDTAGIGIAAMLLGAGRETKESGIDPLAGIVLAKKTGERVRAGEVIAYLHTSDAARVAVAETRFLEAVAIGQGMPQSRPLILTRVTKEGLEVQFRR